MGWTLAAIELAAAGVMQKGERRRRAKVGDRRRCIVRLLLEKGEMVREARDEKMIDYCNI